MQIKRMTFFAALEDNWKEIRMTWTKTQWFATVDGDINWFYGESKKKTF